ncbi:MAG: hypothetical protein D6679_07305 [Candidatus Hydrogenedentota bacterium]|nr:MAG: hypothetical protein D6679_07305 [Candidatus Hydrogenedentota bacterium]
MKRENSLLTRFRHDSESKQTFLRTQSKSNHSLITAHAGGYASKMDECPKRRYLAIRIIKKQGEFFRMGPIENISRSWRIARGMA